MQSKETKRYLFALRVSALTEAQETDDAEMTELTQSDWDEAVVISRLAAWMREVLGREA